MNRILPPAKSYRARQKLYITFYPPPPKPLEAQIVDHKLYDSKHMQK